MNARESNTYDVCQNCEGPMGKTNPGDKITICPQCGFIHFLDGVPNG